MSCTILNKTKRYMKFFILFYLNEVSHSPNNNLHIHNFVTVDKIKCSIMLEICHNLNVTKLSFTKCLYINSFLQTLLHNSLLVFYF